MGKKKKKVEVEVVKMNSTSKIDDKMENVVLLFMIVMIVLASYMGFSAVISKNANASETKPVEYVKAYDADTITVNIKNCKFDLACKKVAIRVYGVDTPELRTKNACEKKLGLIARNFVRAKLAKAKKVELVNMIRGKYFRYVANVIIDGKDLSKELIAKKYAVEYFGETKQIVDWCKMGGNE